MPQPPGDEASRQAVRHESERLSKCYDAVRVMLPQNMSLDRDTCIRMSGLDPDDVGAEREADFPEPFQRPDDDRTMSGFLIKSLVRVGISGGLLILGGATAGVVTLVAMLLSWPADTIVEWFQSKRAAKDCQSRRRHGSQDRNAHDGSVIRLSM